MAEQIGTVYPGAVSPPMATPPDQKAQTVPAESGSYEFVPSNVPESAAAPEQQQGRVIDQMV